MLSRFFPLKDRGLSNFLGDCSKFVSEENDDDFSVLGDRVGFFSIDFGDVGNVWERLEDGEASADESGLFRIEFFGG